MFWCQELQAGDLEQLSAHLARSLVFSNPNVVLGEESPPSSLCFPKSVVLIHPGYQFSFCPLLQALQGCGKSAQLDGALLQAGCWLCHGTAWGGSCAFVESSLFGEQSFHHILPGTGVLLLSIAEGSSTTFSQGLTGIPKPPGIYSPVLQKWSKDSPLPWKAQIKRSGNRDTSLFPP